MKTAQLIKRLEQTIYLNDVGEILTLSEIEKLSHLISGKKTKILKTEEIICRFRAISKKELEIQYWNYMESEKIIDCENYFMVIDN